MKPFWALAKLVTTSESPRTFQVSLEDIVADAGRVIDGDLSQYSAKGTPFSEGDVLFGKLRPYLAKYWLADRDGTAGGDIHVYRPASDVDPRYLTYVVGSRNFVRYAEAASKGVKMPRAEWMSLRDYRVPAPNLDTQRAIADYLDHETGEIDAMIAKMDDLRGALELRRISGINRVFATIEETMPLWSLTEGVIDCPHTTPEVYDAGEAEAVRTASVRAGTYLPGKGLRVSRETAADRNGAFPPRPGDIFFTREAPAGEAAIVPDGEFCLGQRMVLLRVDPKIADSRFLLYAMYSTRVQEEFMLSAGGSTVVNLKLGTIRTTQIPRAALGEQKRIADHLDEVTVRIDAMLAKVAELKTLLIERRAALITDVVTGRKEVA